VTTKKASQSQRGGLRVAPLFVGPPESRLRPSIPQPQRD
jgi:hypothetical protein